VFVIDRRRLEALTDLELRRQMRTLSREWEEKGRPSEDQMPREMLARYVALKCERERRGFQLYLF
jgi:hypothetical protein